MIILTPSTWTDYDLLDSGDYKKLERFGPYTVVRPDPQVMWKKNLSESLWKNADAIFERISEDKGIWRFHKKTPQRWTIKYDNLTLLVKLSPFKHTGVFPEQEPHWRFIQNILAKNHNQLNSGVSTARKPSILNLFGYTGISTLITVKSGAKVTHVDASYPAIGWAKENQKLSGLENEPIRWIEDDVIKFCQREVRRGNKYDGIIMDPPAFGHGPKGEVWKFNTSLPTLLSICSQLISDKPLFIIINAYAVSISALSLKNLLQEYFKGLNGYIDFGELALQERSTKRLLSTGIFVKWSK